METDDGNWHSIVSRHPIEAWLSRSCPDPPHSNLVLASDWLRPESSCLPHPPQSSAGALLPASTRDESSTKSCRHAPLLCLASQYKKAAMRLCVATMAAECFAAGARHGHFCKKTPGLIVTINCDMNILNTNYAECPLDISSSSRRLIFRTFCVACLRSPPPSRAGEM